MKEIKVRDIAELIEKEAPLELAYSWDNPGLLVGNAENSVKKILVTLDTNFFTVSEAAAAGCDMIVSHHPVFFRGIKKINTGEPLGKMTEIIIKNNISVYAAHTNLDTSPNGINARLAEIFGLGGVRVLEEHTQRKDCGLGRYGDFKDEISAEALCVMTKKKLNTPSVRYAGDINKKIRRLCVASGSCSECIETAIQKGCDAVITGDLKYHETMEYAERGIFIIDAGHYPTETAAIDIFCDILSGCGAELIRSRNKDIFNFI